MLTYWLVWVYDFLYVGQNPIFLENLSQNQPGIVANIKKEAGPSRDEAMVPKYLLPSS